MHTSTGIHWGIRKNKLCKHFVTKHKRSAVERCHCIPSHCIPNVHNLR